MTCECKNQSARVVDNIIASDKLIQASINDWASHAGETPSTLERPGKAQNIGSAVYVPDGGASVGFIGGVLRGYDDGIKFIEDTGHAPIGMTGIRRKDAYTIEILHGHEFSRVGTLVAGPDETFAAMGVVVGCSVGQGVSELKIFAPLYVTCKGDGTITKVSPLFEGSVTFDAANSNPSAGTLRLNHPLKSVTAHQAIAASRVFVDGISKPMTIAAFNNDGGTYTQIHAYEEQDESVFIRHNGTAWEAAQGINKAAYSFSYNSTSGLLTITHPAVRSGAYLTNPVITPYKTANRYAVHSIGTTQTGIICYDNAGNVVKTLDALNWSFFFSIKPALRNMVLTPIPATNEFEVFVGWCHVPVDNLKNVPSGNIWFSGAMNK